MNNESIEFVDIVGFTLILACHYNFNIAAWVGGVVIEISQNKGLVLVRLQTSFLKHFYICMKKIKYEISDMLLKRRKIECFTPISLELYNI